MAKSPEIPDHIQKIADQLGANVTALPMSLITDTLMTLVQEVQEEKEKNTAAKQTCKALLSKLGGSATITSAEAKQINDDFALEYRSDSASDSVYFYLKSKK